MERNVLCPLDGRYIEKAAPAAATMGECAFASARVRAEVAWLEVLASLRLPGLGRFTRTEENLLARLPHLTAPDMDALKAYEFSGRNGIAATRHDVKAVEYFIKEKLTGTSLENRREWVHFALTSEDINSVAYALLLADGTEKALLPALEKLRRRLDALARKEADSVMLARTHGQVAVPTTFGKEVRVFESRLRRQLEELRGIKISCKISGAVGCYNAHAAAFPEVDWERAAAGLVRTLNKGRKIKLFLSPLTTQVDNRDSYAELFDNLRRINIILLDLCQDFWRYISDGWLGQMAVKGEVGSSAMPQKINPICFEGAEGNLQLCNVLLGFFSSKLPVSRLQRDLSDSTVLRNMGMAFGYALTAYCLLEEGLGRVAFNRQAAREAAQAHPEVLAEAYQTILRAAGVEKPYEKLKAFTRGHRVTQADLDQFIDKLDVSEKIKKRLRTLTVCQYTGYAVRQAGGKK